MTTADTTDGQTTADSGVFARLVPDGIRRSYLLKFALATGIVLLVVGGIGYAVKAQTSETLRSDVQQSLTSQTESEAEGLSDFIESKQLPAKLISDDRVFEDGTNGEIQAYLQTEKDEKLSESVTAIHYIDTREETIITSTDDGRVGENITDAPWFSRYAFNSFDDVIVTEPFEGPNGNTLIAFVSPVNGVFNGAIVLTVEVDSVSDRFQSSINGSFTQVVESSGTVLFAENESATLSPYVRDENTSSVAVERGVEGQSGFVQDGAKEQSLSGDYVAAYAPVAGTDWVVIKHAPASNAYQLSRSVSDGILAFLGAALIGVVAIGATIGRNTARSVTELSKRAAAIESGDYDVELERSRSDEIGELYASIASMRDTLVERLEEAEDAKEDATRARERAESAREEAERLNELLEDRAEAYSEVMEACADGDLTQRMDTDAESDAMADIATSFNEMIAEWEETLVEIKEFAASVDSSSERATQNMQEVRKASEDVSQVTQNITDATMEQKEQVQDVNSEVSHLSATVEQITSTAETVARNAEQTAETGEAGQEAAETALDELANIESQATVAVDAIEDLNEQMGQIGEIVSFITDIAEQTNILALNANIEAARAGKEGEGFSVVASEVKSLAEETQEAATQIEDIISDVQTTADDAVGDIHEMSERVDEGSNTVEQALSALDEMAAQAEDTNVGVQEIKTATEQQAAAAEEVATLSDQVSEVADTTAGEAETVAATAEEQASSTTQVVETVSTLSDRATHLREELDAFSVEDAAVDGNTGNTVTVTDGSGATDRDEH
jgi:methyl-accepting chemotaxis protein